MSSCLNAYSTTFSSSLNKRAPVITKLTRGQSRSNL